MWLSSLSGAKKLPFDPFSLKQQQIYSNPEDWYFYWTTEYLILHTLRAFRAKTMTRQWTGTGTELTEKWRQKLMTIRRSRRTLSYLLFAPSNKLVWTDEGLRKFMFFSPILSELITVSRHTRETSNPWNAQDDGGRGMIELAVMSLSIDQRVSVSF